MPCYLSEGRVFLKFHGNLWVGLSVTNMQYQLELARHYVLDKHVNWQLDYQGCGGRRMEVLWSPQWPLNGRYWRSNLNTMLTKVCIFHGATNDRPLCIPWLWRCACLPSVSFEWTVSDRLPWWPLWTCSKFTATMASMVGSERPVYYPWTTKTAFRLLLCLQRRPGQFWGRTREVQRSQSLCKGIKGGYNGVFYTLPSTRLLGQWQYHGAL